MFEIKIYFTKKNDKYFQNKENFRKMKILLEMQMVIHRLSMSSINSPWIILPNYLKIVGINMYCLYLLPE